MTITAAMLARTKRFEGTVLHMYLDTVGKVTVGTGHMIPTDADAAKLTMKVAKDGAIATAAQKKAEHAEMKKQKKGMKPSYYKAFAKLKIESADADTILEADMEIAETDLDSIFAGYASFPAAAQEALVDMAYNLGRSKFLSYTKLIAACRKADWKSAAAECHRDGIPDDRNDEIRSLFESLVPPSSSYELVRGALAAIGESHGAISALSGMQRISVELSDGTTTARIVSETPTAAASVHGFLATSSIRGLSAESCREARMFMTLAADDLILGQSVPAASEAATCGPILKKIRRVDPEFSTLVRCDDARISFKNEEGTDADRMMSALLRDALVKLAEATAKEWSGTKLRVTEAWDENEEHHGNSLHYEGRAADLTTDPIDPAKLGRVGRLATTCGFDWVLYENAAHLHVSVRR